MQRIQSRAELAAALKGAPRPIGFVPTMGALHAGHAALIRAARAECASVIVSIYVNPTQFSAAADLAAYPRRLDADAVLAESIGANLLFHPSDAEIYPPDEAAPPVDPGPLALRLEGAARPGHFAGVATVVSRLFDLVQPDRAYFGEKDAQQLRVVEWITARRTSGPRISIRRVPTVREADGLALSSRNARLSPAGRTAAAAIPRALDAARDALARGAASVAQVRAAALHLLSQHPELTLEYLDLAHPLTLEALPDGAPVTEALLTIAVIVDDVRLLDECLLGERSGS
ncbi:MAG: pantoate--beta-alanine ligase [Chloroflexi bacterium]|nr:pantoate--beta-alanine ligase [Chloroflexota bacterium]